VTRQWHRPGRFELQHQVVVGGAILQPAQADRCGADLTRASARGRTHPPLGRRRRQVGGAAHGVGTGPTLALVERDDAGRIALSDAEAETVRAALFVAVHHSDDIVGHCDGCFQTITGVERTAIPALLHDLDDLNATTPVWPGGCAPNWTSVPPGTTRRSPIPGSLTCCAAPESAA